MAEVLRMLMQYFLQPSKWALYCRLFREDQRQVRWKECAQGTPTAAYVDSQCLMLTDRLCRHCQRLRSMPPPMQEACAVPGCLAIPGTGCLAMRGELCPQFQSLTPRNTAHVSARDA